MSEEKNGSGLKTVMVLGVIVALVGIGAVKMFGGTVNTKFSDANQTVTDQVTFGGGEGSYIAPSKPSAAPANNRYKAKTAQNAARAAERELAASEKAYAKKDVATRPLEEAEPITTETLEAKEATDRDATKAKHHGVNPMTKTSEDNLSTFSIDVDTASYTQARNYLKNNQKPPASTVRVEEFVNYFDYNYPTPKEGAFGVNLEAAPSPFTAKENTYLLRVGVQGQHVQAKNRKPMHLTFLVDVSGSMSAYDKLPLAQKAMGTLIDHLGKKDTISIVTYAGRVGVVLEPTSASKKKKILDAVNNLKPGGGTAMGSGMELAYQQAVKVQKAGHTNRVIVLSDGDANIGNASHTSILSSIEGYIKDGITMSTIGFGSGGYNDHLMEQLANKGNGNYYFIDSQREANRIFGERLTSTVEVIAKDVKIQVEFNPEVVSEYRLIGYENRDIADEDFRNDAVDAGEIGAGHSVTALYEVVLTGQADLLAKVRVRHKDPETDKPEERNFPMTRADVRSELKDASRSLQFAAAVASFAELLRGSPYASKISYELVKEIAQSTAGKFEERHEFIGLVQGAINAERM